LSSITIGDNVTSIISYAFYDCSGLIEVTIPNSVTSIGSYAFANCTGIDELNIADSETELSIDTYAFKSISPSTAHLGRNISSTIFESNKKLSSITIGDKVTSIGNYAFAYCTGLKSLTIPNSVTSIGESAFSGCTGLTEVAIPNSVTSIGDYAFNGCTGLTEVTIPNSVTSIGNDAFYDCTGLKSVTIPNSVTTIGESAFLGCTGLTDVTIGNSVTSIGNYAFEGCTSLTCISSHAVTPPHIEVNTFPNYNIPLLAASDAYRTANYWRNFTTVAAPYTPTGTTFEDNGLKYEIISITDLTCRLYAIDESVTGENVVIPNTVVYRNRMFTPIEITGILKKGDSPIKSLSIPSSTSLISPGILFNTSLEKLTVNTPITTSFSYFSNIDDLVISASATEIKNDLSTNAIGKITIEDGESELTTTQLKCGDTKEVYLGRNVSSSTFKDMASLEKVTISDKVTAINGYTFNSCTGLTKVTIPNSVTSIGSYAFADCSGLTEVTFGSSVTSIYSYAFNGCKALRSVVSHSTTPPTISNADETFYKDTYLDGVLYVPESSIEAYKAAYGWKNFWEIKPLREYNGVDGIVVDNADDAIRVVDGAICVSGDEPARIVAMNGVTVYSGRGGCSVNVAKGIYIVIVGNTAHKVAVR
jgi:hypothetical protein